MGESGAQTSAFRLSADPPTTAAKTERAPRSPGTRLLLSRLPVTILAAAYVIVFLIRQVPEFAGVHALAQVARQASVLVWASLPGTGGLGAVGANGVFVLLAIVGAIVLAFVAFQQVHPYAHTAVTHVIQHPPSGA